MKTERCKGKIIIIINDLSRYSDLFKSHLVGLGQVAISHFI